MKVSPLLAMMLVSLSLPACQMQAKEGEHHEEHQKIVTTSALSQDVIITQQYVCQIRSRRQIEVKPLQEGYLEKIELKEGQQVTEGQELFRIRPNIYKARLDAEQAKADVSQIKYEQSLSLFSQATPVVSKIDVRLTEAEYKEAQARAAQAKAELDFTVVKAQFTGIVDRLMQQEGSFVDKRDVLTTLSDNEVMWVYFNVPEIRYLEYRAREGKSNNVSQLTLTNSRIELILANGNAFDQQAGNVLTVEGNVSFETGNFKLRADFPNPNRFLRNGQTGTVMVHRTVPNSLVIPQRAVFEVLDKQYVWVIGDDKVVHRRPITVAYELEDKFVIASGLKVSDKFVLDGVQQVKENDKPAEIEFEKPEDALGKVKHPAQ